MHEIQPAAGRVVANDTQNCVAAVDQAVMSFAHLCASIVEVSTASRLPIGTVQSALANAGDGLTKLIASREDMSQATHALTTIQKDSNLRTVSFGCPPFSPSAHTPDAAGAKQIA